jgi:hypothetical protein
VACEGTTIGHIFGYPLGSQCCVRIDRRICAREPAAGTQFRAGQERTTTRPLRANRHQFIANAVEMDEPADEVIFVVRLRGLRVA